MKLTITKQIPVHAERAWHFLGHEFANIASFFSQVDVSRPITPDEVPAGFPVVKGSPVLGRYTESRIFKVREVLSAYSDKDMSFTFDAVDVPPAVFSKSRNTTTIVPIDANSCQVTITVEMGLRHIFLLLSPILRKRMTILFDKLIDEVAAASR